MATRNVLSASTLIGDDIRNPQGEDLGTVKEIMLDIANKTVAYVVVSYGGFLGLGDKLFAIPFERFTVDEDEKCFVLDLDEEALKNAPGFDKDNWPDFADVTWGKSITDYYGRF